MDKFSLQSRRAIVLFTILFMVIILIPRFYFYFKKPIEISLTETIINLSPSEKKEYKKRVANYHKNKGSKFKSNSRYSTPSSKFNPNDYQLADWIRLGLSKKQAQTILNFNKYGFYSEADLKKCFVFQNDAFYNKIKDSLVFTPHKIGGKNDQAYRQGLAIDINRATKEELKSLKGIGDFYADKIIAYREKLGGFITINQLLEIYKFDKEKLLSLKPYLLLDKNDIRPLNLNTVDVRTLKNHPYINDWNIANSIVKIREQKGKYQRVSEIKESVLMTDSLYQKIEPYLKIE